MAYPVNGEPDELGPEQPAPSRERALALLGRRDFRRTFLAVLVSEAGDAFHYVALMWVALVTAGPGGRARGPARRQPPGARLRPPRGLVADRLDRRRTMVAADLVRSATLVPVRVMGLVSLVHRGAHAVGLILVSPLFLFASPRAVFAGAAIALPLVGAVAAVIAVGGGARARARARTPRS